MSTRRTPWIGRAARYAVLLASCTAVESHAGSFLDELGADLAFATEDGTTWAQLSFNNDLTVFFPEAPAPGLLFSDASSFLAPRVSLDGDMGIGRHLLAHARARVDRGFDPGSETSGDARLDEYFLEANLPGPGRPRIRIGKFATAFGGWVDRHLSWDNPLITAPAIYEDMLPITDQTAPAGLAAFTARRDAAENKAGWVPVIWGPSYASGASFSVASPTMEVTIEVKNAALSSRPETWDAVDDGFETDPTFTGRLSWHPGAAWTVGASFSHGPYLQPAASDSLPPEARVDDFDQRTLGVDVTYERHRLQIWGEAVQTRFDVPRVGQVEALSGFLEARYKLAPRFWFAGRVNHARFDDTPELDEAWDRNLSRLDLGIGYRHSAHVQAKLEYSIGDQRGADTNGNRLAALQFVMWF